MSTDVQGILRLRVPIIVRLGSRQMSVDDVLSLGPGSIIELPKQSDEELELMVNNKNIGSGTAVKIGENFGISVTEIGDPRSRIEALAGAGPQQIKAPPPADKGVSDAEADAMADAILAQLGG